MDDVVEISGLDNACRLCLTTEQTRSSIFGVPHVSVPFVEKIRACLSIQVSVNDKVSTLVCTSCIKNINQWHTYKDVCLKSQEKLQQWLSKQSTIIQPAVTVKEEPMDEEFSNDMQVTVNDSTNVSHAITNFISMNNIENNLTSFTNTSSQIMMESQKENEKIDKDSFPSIQIKNEPLDTEDEDDFNIDVESVNSGELLINPMAVAVTNTSVNDRTMEADSTQKFGTKRLGYKKRMRQGPRTHYRQVRIFKKKCIHCKIYLHSKYSYMQHMSRYHGIINNLPKKDLTKPPNLHSRKNQKSKLSQNLDNVDYGADTQNETDPEDAEFEKMIKTDPLTPVQKNLISQLKTFSCYTCKQAFFDRKHTLNHIRQHMPDLRPFTCIACLTEFSDRSMYKIHCGASFECAMKIALVVPKVGFEKYFTCNMCLRSFSNRKELLIHLAMHADKQYKQLNQPVISPPKLKPINSSTPASKVDSASSHKSVFNQSGPYVNGDPAHNHMCDLCGMIYKHKPNMFKHRDLCSTLPENIRTSYKCIHCNMTYLVYKKFYNHVLHYHKKHEITCYTCQEKFATPDDYLSHHETHRVQTNQDEIQDNQPYNNYSMKVDPMNSSTNPVDVTEKPFNCALCGEDFTTKLELTEHRNLHLKVKIYSCVICRSMFSSSGALEIHMKDHGIEDPSEQNANSSCLEYDHNSHSQGSSLNESSTSATSDTGAHFNHCYDCGKNFSNLANLKRHQRNVHSSMRRRWSCDECRRRFKSLEAYNKHMNTEHQLQKEQQLYIEQPIVQSQVSSITGKPLMQCPKCPRTFTYQGNLIQHCQNVHKENHFERAKAVAARQSDPSFPRFIPSRGFACDLCGKIFREKQSLKTHRGWHLRTTYRLKVDQNASLDENMLSGPGFTMRIANSSEKPAKARKSFPNNPPQKQLNAIAKLQCQVCDDRFTDVAELRKHLWDIHCARNKPEKIFTSELQCELCTNKFSDEESLENHMKWHLQNPILSNNSNSKSNDDVITSVDTIKKSFHCDTCGKYYSNRKLFLRHKKLHKTVPVSTMMNFQSLQTKRHFCRACQKNFSTDASLRRHKASSCHMHAVRRKMHSQMQAPAKKITTTALVHHPPPDSMRLQTINKEPDADYQVTSQASESIKKKSVTCHTCKTIFPNMSVLYRHKQLVHKVPIGERNKSNLKQNKCVQITSSEGTVSCHLCGKQFPGVSNLKIHFVQKHKVKNTAYPCSLAGCKFVFSSADSLKNHEVTHTNLIYNCHLCGRHTFSRVAMKKHMLSTHKAIYQSGVNKNTLWSEIDLTNYQVKNCTNTVCPKCKVKYPNLRALKIHYLKNHEKT